MQDVLFLCGKIGENRQSEGFVSTTFYKKVILLRNGEIFLALRTNVCYNVDNNMVGSWRKYTMTPDCFAHVCH